jgi:Domain of unknown function (DUF4268)
MRARALLKGVNSGSFAQLVDTHKRYLEKIGEDSTQAEQSLLKFLEWEEPDDDRFANAVRILLASANFSKELTTSVLWLNEQGVDIRCVRLKPYRDTDGAVILDVQQLIPLREAAAYQTQIKAKERAGRTERAQRYDLRYQFWSKLLAYARTQTDLHAGRSPGIYGWIGGGIGRAGFHLNYVVRETDSQVELFIDQGPDSDELNLKLFNALLQKRKQIESVFGHELDWQDLPESRSCRIRFVIQGGYRSPETDWPEIQQKLVASMIALDKAFRPFVHDLPIDSTN